MEIDLQPDTASSNSQAECGTSNTLAWCDHELVYAYICTCNKTCMYATCSGSTSDSVRHYNCTTHKKVQTVSVGGSCHVCVLRFVRGLSHHAELRPLWSAMCEGGLPFLPGWRSTCSAGPAYSLLGCHLSLWMASMTLYSTRRKVPKCDHFASSLWSRAVRISTLEISVVLLRQCNDHFCFDHNRTPTQALSCVHNVHTGTVMCTQCTHRHCHVYTICSYVLWRSKYCAITESYYTSTDRIILPTFGWSWTMKASCDSFSHVLSDYPPCWTLWLHIYFPWASLGTLWWMKLLQLPFNHRKLL